MSLDEKLFTWSCLQESLFLFFIPGLRRDDAAVYAAAIVLGGIPLKCFLYVTLGVPSHDLHPPSHGSWGSSFDSQACGFEIAQAQDFWGLHLLPLCV